MSIRPKVAVHKFSSCDGCQLAFLNMGETLLELSQRVELVHFVEAGPRDEDAEVEIAFVEGSISTPDDIRRIEKIRRQSRYLVTIGACATSGGLQALRNLAGQDWTAAVYAQPRYIESLDKVSAISDCVQVDFEVWGCPVNRRQILAVLRSLLSGAAPVEDRSKLCLECKRRQTVCVMVATGEPCMGPVTHHGCGAICPHFQRGCYACYGPSESPNTDALINRFAGLGMMPEEIARRFHFIHSHNPVYLAAGASVMPAGKKDKA